MTVLSYYFSSCPKVLSLTRPFSSRSPVRTTMNIFDRKSKMRQRCLASSDENCSTYNYLKEEFGRRLADRIFDIKRVFPVAIDLHCGRGHVSKHLTDDMIDNLIMCDTSIENLTKASVPDGYIRVSKVLVDDERIPFGPGKADLIFSSLSMHWINDLPFSLMSTLMALKSDGVFIGSLFGGETLFELRCSLQLAETERQGGFSPHVSPFTQPQDIGALLHGIGFNMITIDSDEICVRYPSMFELMYDLKGMGENNAAWNRKLPLHRDTILAAAAIYRSMYGNDDGSIPATFQVFSFIGWKPDESQPKPVKRGSANFSLKDIKDLDKIITPSEENTQKTS